MQPINNRNQSSALELALLVIFAISLLVAAIVTAIRNKIPMSPPIKLDFASITASVPKGRQWASFNEWKYYKEQNNFVLASTIEQKEFTIAFAELTYVLTPDTLDPVEYLNENLTPSSQIISRETINRNGIDILWYRVKQQAIAGGIYLAAARLPADKMLQIKIFAYRDEALAEKIFNVIMKNISFEKNQPLEDGLSFVKLLKEEKLPTLIRNETGRSMARIYLVNKSKPIDGKTPKQNTFDGFAVERFSFNNDPEKMPLQCTSFFMTDAADGIASYTSFQSDLSFDTFAWSAKHYTSQGKPISETQIELDRGGLLSFINIHAEPSPVTIRPGPLAVPEIFLDTAATRFLNYQAETIYIDFIFANGQIAPVRMSRIKPEDINANTKDIAFTINMQLLCYPDKSMTINFDKNHAIVSKLENINVMVIGHRSNAKALLNAFPERTEQINKILK